MKRIANSMQTNYAFEFDSSANVLSVSYSALCASNIQIGLAKWYSLKTIVKINEINNKIKSFSVLRTTIIIRITRQ